MKKIIIIGSLVALIVLAFLFSMQNKNEETPAPGTDQIQKNEKETNENSNIVVVGNDNDNVIFKDKRNSKNNEVVFEDEGYSGKEPAEKKIDDYSHLLGAEPVGFAPDLPKYIAERDIQSDLIKGYYNMPVKERYEYMEQKSLTKEERKELDKIKQVNSQIEEAFLESDYNKYLDAMHKDWRLDFGVRMIGIVHNGRFEEEMIEFFPEVIDTKLGVAYGIYFKKLVYIENGRRGNPDWKDGVIIYKQNEEGQWEIYYEIPF